MTTRATEHLVVLQPEGDLCEGPACDELQHELFSHAERGRLVIVDLSVTRIVTAHCLGVLVRAQRLAVAAGGDVALCGPTELHRWLLGVTHLADALPVYASQAEALAGFASRSAVA